MTSTMTQHNALMNTYGRQGIGFVKGEGCWLSDQQGRRYFDAISGIGVNNLGHSHPDVTAAIQKQAATLMHTSNLYQIDLQSQLAQCLQTLSGMDKVFFANSGAEANEAAIKLARLYGHKQGIERPKIVTMQKSFHGRTMATLSATGNSKVQQGFTPLLEAFIHVPFNDVAAVAALSDDTNIVAVLVEPVQGEGGVHVPDENYLNQLQQLCQQNQWLLMLDEIQTGNGRTGSYFACQQSGVLPDVLTTAKGLGNGVPIGACLAQGQAAELFVPGHHGSTFGGNPLACAAALAVTETIEKEQLCQRAQHLGQYILTQFEQNLAQSDKVKNVRGKGLMIGIELHQDCPELVSKALEKGLLINVTAGNTIRLLPPLIMSDDEAKALCQGVIELVDSL